MSATVIPVTRPNPNNFTLFEGPVWVDGALYFSLIDPNFHTEAPRWESSIYKHVPGTADAELFLENAGSNGMAVDANGVMYSATTRKREISQYNLSTKAQTTALAGAFNSPNDIAIALNGTMYFSDQLQQELAPATTQYFGLYMVRDGQAEQFPSDGKPVNGVSLSPNNDTLYFTVTGEGRIMKAALKEDGTADAVTDFATGLSTPDGMTVDCLGNVYVAEHNAQRVVVFSPEGAEIASIKTGTGGMEQATTNVAFGGSDRKTLFITAVNSLWSIELDVAGYPY